MQKYQASRRRRRRRPKFGVVVVRVFHFLNVTTRVLKCHVLIKMEIFTIDGLRKHRVIVQVATEVLPQKRLAYVAKHGKRKAYYKCCGGLHARGGPNGSLFYMDDITGGIASSLCVDVRSEMGKKFKQQFEANEAMLKGKTKEETKTHRNLDKVRGVVLERQHVLARVTTEPIHHIAVPAPPRERERRRRKRRPRHTQRRKGRPPPMQILS